MARFSNPADLAIDSTGNLYVADNLNSTIRKIVLGSSVRDISVSTFVGTAGVIGRNKARVQRLPSTVRMA